MSTDWKALCAELVHGWTEGRDIVGPMANARTLLSQPEPEGPTDEALASFTAYFCRNYPGPYTIIHKPEWHAPKIFHAAADALARWGRPAIEPVPVSEKPWEREGWCDSDGWCWRFDADGTDPCWSFDRPEAWVCWTHVPPHYALPTPQP